MNASVPHPTLETERLRLRPWGADDRPVFAAMNADRRVCEFLPSTLTPEQSNILADRIEQHFDEHGFGLWAVEVPDFAPFIGFVGLSVPRFEAHFTPCVEVGWRLDAAHWNRGYATEGARAAVAFGFERLHLEQIVSFTVPLNRRSRRVMEKLGMRTDPREDFDHPGLPAAHRLRRHVLYRLSNPTLASCG